MIQKALKNAGYDPGPVDGSLGGKTVQAIKSYQRRKGLAVGGLTLETLETLGLKPRA